MEWILVWWRAVNIALAIAYIPLLYFRIRDTNEKENLPYLIGMFFLVVGIIVGSYHYLRTGWNPALPFTTVGMIVVISTSAAKQWTSGRKRLNRGSRDGR